MQQEERPQLQPADRPVKKPRTSTACEGCRKKRSKCDGVKPICRPCKVSGISCVYDLAGDRRKPYTKDVVVAMQMRIDALEYELAALHVSAGSTPLPTGVQFYGGPALAPRNVPQDAFQGGLALNTHGELRFYGPTSSYRTMIADSSSLPRSKVSAAQAFSLTRAPLPTAIPADPVLPRRPPVLEEAFRNRVVRLAFEYGFSQFNLVQEQEFCVDMLERPNERTSDYSPFLYNIVLAIGCRYLSDSEPSPIEICGEMDDLSTRGDVFISWARYMLDQEWLNPQLSTVRALTCLAAYLAGRGLDGPCWMYSGQAMRLAEDFGLHLGIHRLSLGSGEIKDTMIVARRNAFYAAFSTDVLLSMYIGRSPTFSTDDLDQIPPVVDQDVDFVEPMYRSSGFHWSSQLMLIGSKIMSTIYALKPGISLSTRQAAVPELHLALETWYHGLPSFLRASTTVSSKAPHGHVIGLNMLYFTMMIQLHRPFFRRSAPDQLTQNVSTEKCLSAAKHITRLVKLQKEAHGVRFVAASFQHACFCCGTILALSAVENGISFGGVSDADRRAQAQDDLRTIVAALKEIGLTWRTAFTSASVLEALMSEWGTETPASELQPPTDAFWPMDDMSTGSFPFIFPSWDLEPADASSYDDFMSLLNPVEWSSPGEGEELQGGLPLMM